jgi:hypothetical protein
MARRLDRFLGPRDHLCLKLNRLAESRQHLEQDDLAMVVNALQRIGERCQRYVNQFLDREPQPQPRPRIGQKETGNGRQGEPAEPEVTVRPRKKTVKR